MSPIINKIANGYLTTMKGIDFLRPAFYVGIRLWLAQIFFMSGLTKIQSWETTKMLFAYEYNVPLLPPELAAFLGTGAELVLPVLLVLGILTRPTALALFVFNYIAVISYPDISPAGVANHIMWGVMLAATFFNSGGFLSLDHWVKSVYTKKITGQSDNRGLSGLTQGA